MYDIYGGEKDCPEGMKFLLRCDGQYELLSESRASRELPAWRLQRSYSITFYYVIQLSGQGCTPPGGSGGSIL